MLESSTPDAFLAYRGPSRLVRSNGAEPLDTLANGETVIEAFAAALSPLGSRVQVTGRMVAL